MNILLVPDASVNREAAAVYRVKMSQTSLGLHSKCISMCKHTLQYSGTLTHKNYICTCGQCWWRCYNIVLDSNIISLPPVFLCDSSRGWAANLQLQRFQLEKKLLLRFELRKLWVEICVRYLFILTLRCKCFQHGSSSPLHIQNSCVAHVYNHDESQRWALAHFTVIVINRESLKGSVFKHTQTASSSMMKWSASFS